MIQQYISLLFPDKKPNFQNIPPTFFADLQLEGISKAIISKYMEFDIRKYLYTLPNSLKTVEYRQEIYRDLEKNKHLVLGLKQYTNRLLEAERSYKFYLQIEDTVKKGSYLLLTCQNYLAALDLLAEILEQATMTSQGLNNLYQFLQGKMNEPDFQIFRDKVESAFAYMEQLNLTLLLKDHEISVLEQDQEKEDSIIIQLQEFMKAFGVEVDQEQTNDVVENIFPAPLETSALENTIIDILQRSRPEAFRMLKDFSTFSFSLEDDCFVTLKEEFVFFISFYEFEQLLKEVGYSMQYPQINVDGSFFIENVYDVALAWKNRFSSEKVVPNDISYQKEKSFLVITGPNQGGKTTLARAMGQSVYFMLLGLKAPCSTMTTPFFERILTHFEVEESVETGAGKLKEELQRLRPMMLVDAKNSFVILNELFTTATTYDAKIMARRVMEHFMEHHCWGIYVTHIQELADEKQIVGIQSMVAQVDKQDHSVRTFRIIPMKAEGLGYSDSIVKKYHLGYDQMTERIADL